mmetsp:Transcript_18133/g.36572  ORF Transcript_18133/g.36572 Transcript_18133/m.36572 type:complete len:209 (+) Transcript_18133:626-1252(+)
MKWVTTSTWHMMLRIPGLSCSPDTRLAPSPRHSPRHLWHLLITSSKLPAGTGDTATTESAWRMTEGTPGRTRFAAMGRWSQENNAMSVLVSSRVTHVAIATARSLQAACAPISNLAATTEHFDRKATYAGQRPIACVTLKRRVREAWERVQPTYSKSLEPHVRIPHPRGSLTQTGCATRESASLPPTTASAIHRPTFMDAPAPDIAPI